MIPADGLIETAHPDLTRTEEYIQFDCPCGARNGTNVFTDAQNARWKVCGACYEKAEA